MELLFVLFALSSTLVQAKGIFNGTLGDRGLSGTLGDAGLNGTLSDHGLNETLSDAGLSGTPGDRGLNETLGDAGQRDSVHVKLQGLNETLSDRGLNETLGDAGLNETLSDRGLNETLHDAGLNGTLGDRGLSETLGDHGLNETLSDAGLNGTLYDHGLNVTLSDAGLNGTLSDSAPEPLRCWQTFNGRSFRFFPDADTWAGAQRHCLELNGNLATVRGAGEEAFVKDVAEGRAAWIGLSDAQEDGSWFWINSDALSFTKWCNNEPNNHGGPEQCVEINFSAQKCWNDARCSVRRPYVCEKKWT